MTPGLGPVVRWCTALVVARALYPASLQQAADRGLLRTAAKGRVHVLGTVHAGNASAMEARALIEHVRPDTVVVEMDKDKAKSLVLGPARPAGGRRRSADGGLLLDLSSRHGCFGALMWSELRAQQRQGGGGDRAEDEFAAAVAAAVAAGAAVVGADPPLEELSRRANDRLTAFDWARVFAGGGTDPVKRRDGEAYGGWLDRRRSPATAAASVRFQEARCAALSGVLLGDRDAALAAGVPASGTAVVVCGLAHAPGVAARLGVDAPG